MQLALMDKLCILKILPWQEMFQGNTKKDVGIAGSLRGICAQVTAVVNEQKKSAETDPSSSYVFAMKCQVSSYLRVSSYQRVSRTVVGEKVLKSGSTSACRKSSSEKVAAIRTTMAKNYTSLFPCIQEPRHDIKLPQLCKLSCSQFMPLKARTEVSVRP